MLEVHRTLAMLEVHRTLAMLEVHRTLAMLEIQQDNSTAVSQRTQPFIFLNLSLIYLEACPKIRFLTLRLISSRNAFNSLIRYGK
jgi:hypothetical protein